MAKTKTAYYYALQTFIIFTIVTLISSLAVLAVPALMFVIPLDQLMVLTMAISIVSTVISVLWIALLVILFALAWQGGTAAPATKSRVIYGLCVFFAIVSIVLNNLASHGVFGEDETIKNILSGVVALVSFLYLIMSIIALVHVVRVKKALA